MNILDLAQMKKDKRRISMVTCYDYWSAQIIDETAIDMVLVGDSLAMVMHGSSTTLGADTDLMCLHIQAVAKGAPHKFIIGDMPFMSFRKDLSASITNAEKMMRAGCHALKIEGVEGHEPFIKHLVQSGIPVMGHLGLTPQSVHQLGGFKVQGKDDSAQKKIFEQSHALQDLGCFALVLECIPKDLGKKISEDLLIPTIGIGAGPDTDGQVLVLHDLLGFNTAFRPRFLRSFMNGYELMNKALTDYDKSVKDGSFPSKEESY